MSIREINPPMCYPLIVSNYQKIMRIGKNPILNQQSNDNLLKTLETFTEDFPKDFSIFDKIIQNRFVQNLY
jgi:hypothetical protein